MAATTFIDRISGGTTHMRLTGHNDFVILGAALERLGITESRLNEVFEAPPLDRDDANVAYGPSFGGEAAESFHKRLEDLGLRYVDDYFVVAIDLPDWLELSADVADAVRTPR